jgi:hypothetical protein
MLRVRGMWDLRQDVGVVFTPRAQAHAVWAREQTWLSVEHFYDILVEDYFVHGDDY